MRVAVARRIFQEHAELGGGVPGPMRAVHQPPRDRHHVGLAVGEDGLGLARLGDLADRHGGDAGAPPHRFSQRHLVAGLGVDLLLERHAAAGGADVIAAARLELLGEGDRVVDVPAARDPVGHRNPHPQRPLGRKGAPAELEDLEPQPHAVRAAAAVAVVAPVDERRKELIDDVAVGEMQLDHVGADLGHAAGGVAPRSFHALDQLEVHDRRRRMHAVLVVRWRERSPAALLAGHRAADHERRQHRGLASRMRQLHAELGGAVLAIETDDAGERLLVRVAIEPQAHGRDAPLGLDRGRLGDHQAQIGQRVLPEMDQMPVAGMAVVRRILAHRRQHDAVVEGQSPHGDRREQFGFGHDGAAFEGSR